MLSTFIVPELGNSSSIIIEGDEAHHAIKVVRLNIGEEIVVTDGQGNWAKGVVSEIGKKNFQLTVSERGFEEARTPELIVIQALTKSDRMRETMELLTVAGVDRIIPWKAARSIAQEKESSVEKWSAVSIAAAKQSRRIRFPIIEAPISTQQIAERLGSEILVLHESASMKLSEVKFSNPQTIVFVVGPEGGISEAELATLSGSVVRLGQEVLRSAHAGFAALAAVQTLIQRW